MKKDRIIDFSGFVTGIPLSAKNLILLGIAIVVPVLTNLIPFGEGAQLAGLALGFSLSVMILLIGGVVSIGTAAVLLTFLGLSAGLLSTGEIMVGTLFYQFVGFCVIGYGAGATPFGKRFSYMLLKHLGRSPTKIVIAFLVVSVVLSSFLSNTAITIMMAAICHQVMQQMGQEAGKSKFAVTCMLACALGPSIGGPGFIQGFGGTNMYAIQQMASVTEGGFRISPLQWAVGGWSGLLFILPISAFIILKMAKFDPKEISVLEKETYDKHLKELGPVTGSELRWIIYAVAMIVLMMAGVDTTVLLLVLITLCVLPGVGCFSAKDVFTKGVPWEVVLCGVGMCVMGTMFSNSGLTTVIANLVAPMLKNIPPFMIILLLALIVAVINMYLVAMTYPSIAIGIVMTAPIIEALGLNPAIVLFPAMVSVQYAFGLFAHPLIQHNYRYGYWEKGKITGVSTVIMLCAVLVNSLVAYFLLPTFWGTPLYL